MGFMPTREEAIATAEAVERHFPYRHQVKVGQLQMRGAIFHYEDIAKVEGVNLARFLEKPAYDGFFGFKLGQRDKQGNWSQTLSVYGVPPGEDLEGKPLPRASFVELALPADNDPERLYDLALELADILPIRSGYGGYSLFTIGRGDEARDSAAAAWQRRFWGLDRGSVDGFLPYTREGLLTAQWLTLLGLPFQEALTLPSFSPEITTAQRKGALVIRAGAKPTLGDRKAGDFPRLYAEVDSVLAPLRSLAYQDNRLVGMAGNFFRTQRLELAGFAEGETARWLKRFENPAGWPP